MLKLLGNGKFDMNSAMLSLGKLQLGHFSNINTRQSNHRPLLEARDVVPHCIEDIVFFENLRRATDHEQCSPKQRKEKGDEQTNFGIL